MQTVIQQNIKKHCYDTSIKIVSARMKKTGSIMVKRDRKLRNKSELTRLQRRFEACTGEIVSLEKSKVTNASVIAYEVGVVGCTFMAGSVFAVTAGIYVFFRRRRAD